MEDKYIVNFSDLKSIADAIREVTQTSKFLSFPDGFIEEIKNIKISSENN